MIIFQDLGLCWTRDLDYGLRVAMKNGSFYSIFLALFLLWGYWYPYQWYMKYGLPEIKFNEAQAATEQEDSHLNLPKTFWGASLAKAESSMKKSSSNPSGVVSDIDLSGLILDEVKSCFGEGSVMQVSKSRGDMNHFIMSLQKDLGPVQEDLLLEKKATMTMKDGKTRTLVYEWISPEEGSDLYWHETDDEGFPRPIALPENMEHDLVTFEQLKNQGNIVTKVAETRLVQLDNDLQIGIEKTNDTVESMSIKDEGHLIKCRRDPVKNYVCDCLN